MSTRIEIYRSGLRRKLRWRYVAGNGHILADSGQGYTRRIDALNAAARVTGTRVAGSQAEPVLVGHDRNGEHRRITVRQVAR